MMLFKDAVHENLAKATSSIGIIILVSWEQKRQDALVL